MKFIDRKKELEFLNEEYNSPCSSLVIIYGRRRVGKTALICEFIKGKDSLYFLATTEGESANIREFKTLVAEFTGSQLLKEVQTDNWEPLFREITTKNTESKTVIVIDEFQYLGKSNPAFPSVMQKIWDTLLQHENIMLILCGSLITMMKEQTLEYSSPLYGRRTGQLKLRQIPFRHYYEFYPDLSPSELVEYYSVTGGIPKYIELFRPQKDIYLAIEKNIISKSAFFYEEPDFLFNSEVTETGTYMSIVKAIAMGKCRLSQIASYVEIKQTSLSKYLKTLIDMDIIERIVPVTENNPEKSKKGIYSIKDNFLSLWFKFIYPFRSYIESGNEAIVDKKIRESLISHHTAFIYEDICREKIWDLNADGRWDFIFEKVGKWWNKTEEIDIVALDSTTNSILFGECKYRKEKTGANVLKELERRAALVDWKSENRNCFYIIFSISGFTDELIETAKVRNDLQLFAI